jgi:TonB family protein
MKFNRPSVVVGILIAAVAQSAHAQSPRPTRKPERPLPAGQEIFAGDGDRVVIENDARVRVITRRRGLVRAVYGAEQRWLILMIDSTSPETGAPDGKPDAHFTFSGLEGDWPLGNRWEGYTTIDQYNQSFPPRPGGVGITAPDGLIQIFTAAPPAPIPEPANIFRDPSAYAVLTHRGFGNGNGGSATFDQMEQGLVTSVMRNAQMENNPPVRISAGGGTVAPVRVGGAVANPQQITHVAPVYPEAARRANLTGVVILEVAVAPDGSVSNARILRSIPLLDQPALDAVRQWRFEPTLLNGTAVPVILTVSVQFPPR